MFKAVILVYKTLQGGSSRYFVPSLSPSSCSHSTRCSHPGCQYLTVPAFHSSLYKSVKHFGHSFALIFRMIFLMMYAVQHLLPPSGKSSKRTSLQKPTGHSLTVTPLSSCLTWLCYWTYDYSVCFCSVVS